MMMLIALVSSCQKESHNGKLDGTWQLLTIKHLDTGVVDNVKEYQRFYCIQLEMIYLQNGGGQGLFTYSGNKLDVRMVGSKKEDVIPFGFTDTTQSFIVEKLGNSNMVLRTVDNELTFRRF